MKQLLALITHSLIIDIEYLFSYDYIITLALKDIYINKHESNQNNIKNITVHAI